MAFNPFQTFQKNKRFWMAAILMVCMVSFVFCTGMKGDMADRIGSWFGGRSGASIVRIAGRTYSRKDLEDLKTQRNLANAYMRHCNEIAYRNVDKALFDLAKDDKEGDREDRPQRMLELSNMLRTLGIRRQRPRYFEGDVKYRDLEEFLLWRAEADRLGIRIEENHLTALFRMEFFGVLRQEDLYNAEREARSREHREAGHDYIRRAVADEFRVRIAQYAVFGAQPYSYFQRKERTTLEAKYIDPNMPDQLRAPMTLAQIWDFHKAKRAEFTVKLLPVYVEDFARNKFVDPNSKDKNSFLNKKIQDPDDQLLRDFFEAHKNEPYDPTSDKWGLETPLKIKIEYVYADPASPEYVGVAKALAVLSRTTPMLSAPLTFDPMGGSPLMSLVRCAAVDLAIENDHHENLERLVRQMGRSGRFYRATVPMPAESAAMLEVFAGRHSQAVASLVGGALSSPLASEANFLAWGTLQNPLEGETGPFKVEKGKDFKIDKDVKLKENMAEREIEAKRRDLIVFSDREFDALKYMMLVGQGATGQVTGSFAPAKMTSLRHELEAIIDRDTAERWAQENMWGAKKELELANGDAAKYRRELKKIVPKYNLTYGPPDDKKANFYDQFTIGDAPEFAPLKESYLKYMHQINLFEGRDTPDRKLTEADFHKLFFGEASFVSAGKFEAKPWPPEVKASRTRDFRFVDSRAARGVTPDDWDRLRKHVEANDPTQQVPSLDLYRTAGKPILYWRTAVLPARREGDYRKIVNDLRTLDELRQVRAGLVILNSLGAALGIDGAEKALRDRETQLSANQVQLIKDEADFRFIEARVIEGLKFKRAREEAALPHAKAIALELLSIADREPLLKKMQLHAATMQRSIVDIPRLSEMHAEDVYRGEDVVGVAVEARKPNTDYFPPPLADGTIKFAHDKTMEQLISLVDLKKPFEVGSKDIDEINKDLFDKAKKGQYIQILTNKPRDVYYVAAITEGPTVSDMSFQVSMMRASLGPRDLFLERAQKAHVEQYRAQVLSGLRLAHAHEVMDKNAARALDGDRDP